MPRRDIGSRAPQGSAEQTRSHRNLINNPIALATAASIFVLCAAFALRMMVNRCETGAIQLLRYLNVSFGACTVCDPTLQKPQSPRFADIDTIKLPRHDVVRGNWRVSEICALGTDGRLCTGPISLPDSATVTDVRWDCDGRHENGVSLCGYMYSDSSEKSYAANWRQEGNKVIWSRWWSGGKDPGTTESYSVTYNVPHKLTTGEAQQLEDYDRANERYYLNRASCREGRSAETKP